MSLLPRGEGPDKGTPFDIAISRLKYQVRSMSSQDTVKQKILDKADIVEVVSQYVQLQKRGGRFFGLCPFHSEKTPSFSVNAERGFYHCFGCGRGGNAIDFVMNVENLTYPEARTYLANKLSIPLEEPTRRHRSHSEIDRYQVMEQAAILYEKWLTENDEAARYVRSRGLTPDFLKQFSIGYAPNGWDQMFNALKTRNIPQEVQQELGLVVPRNTGNGCYDRFRNRVMFPIRNTLGRIIAFGGRAMDPSDPAKYLNTNDTPLFNKSKVLYLLDRAKDRLKERGAILVEGYMDAISMHMHGFNQAVATLGTALTPDHVQILRRYTQKFTLLYDGDNAGINAARRGVEVFFEQGLSPLVAILPGGQDPDDYVKSGGKDAMQNLLDQAIDGFDFYLQQALKKHNPATPNGKMSLVEEVAPLFARLPEQLLVNDYTARMASRIGSDINALKEALRNRMASVPNYNRPVTTTPIQQEEKQEIPEPVKNVKEGLIRLLAFHLGTIIPDGMFPSEKPTLFAQTDIENDLTAHLGKLKDGSSYDSLLGVMIKEILGKNKRQKEVSSTSASKLETLFTKPEQRTLFIAIVEKEPLPNTEKQLRTMRDEVWQNLLTLVKQREFDELRRQGDLKALNAMLFQQGK